jgi:hypothetical protein
LTYQRLRRYGGEWRDRLAVLALCWLVLGVCVCRAKAQTTDQGIRLASVRLIAKLCPPYFRETIRVTDTADEVPDISTCNGGHVRAAALPWKDDFEAAAVRNFVARLFLYRRNIVVLLHWGSLPSNTKSRRAAKVAESELGPIGKEHRRLGEINPSSLLKFKEAQILAGCLGRTYCGMSTLYYSWGLLGNLRICALHNAPLVSHGLPLTIQYSPLCFHRVSLACYLCQGSRSENGSQNSGDERYDLYSQSHALPYGLLWAFVILGFVVFAYGWVRVRLGKNHYAVWLIIALIGLIICVWGVNVLFDLYYQAAYGTQQPLQFKVTHVVVFSPERSDRLNAESPLSPAQRERQVSPWSSGATSSCQS